MKYSKLYLSEAEKIERALDKMDCNRTAYINKIERTQAPQEEGIIPEPQSITSTADYWRSKKGESSGNSASWIYK